MGFFDKLSDTVKTTSNSYNSIPKKEKAVIDAIFAITLKDCKRLKTDLVECPKHKSTCRICAIYQDRVYSISGKDKRFPKLPDCVYQYGGFHEGCRHLFYPFTFGISTMSSGNNDAIKWSNRPFK